MILTSPGLQFIAIFEGAAPGLLPQLTFGVLESTSGIFVIPVDATAIIEIAQLDGTSTYEATRVMPADAAVSSDTVTYQTAWPDTLVDAQEDIAVVPALVIPDVMPTVADVGVLERDRTVDKFGNELGTFNSDTRPSDVQVQNLITKAYNDVTTYTGTDIPALVISDVRDLITLRTAMYVELSHFGEQVARGNSPYDDYKELYEGSDGKGGQKKQVVEAVEAAKTGDTPGPVTNYAKGSFPADAGGMVGWGTRW